jgi:heat shock protein HtpX
VFYPLPAETVFEAKERNRRATFFLLGSLIFLYVFFFDLLALVVYVWLSATARHLPSDFAVILGWSSGLALAAALFHFNLARNRSLDSLLSQIGAVNADRADQLHLTFIHVVEEAAAAIGAPGVQAVVLSAPGLNAFSMEDGRGQKAIGITEGLLAKLNRGELSAVVAHEAAHLLHEDSKLVTTACFLFGVFGTFQTFLGGVMNTGAGAGVGGRRRGGGSALVILWLISALGYLVTKLIFMAVSREREYLADADGVQMCKDPLALAESLYKISNRYRGGLSATFSALFIVNPQESQLDEGEGWFSNLFSTHPPLDKRLKKLLDWAKSDLATLQAMDAQEEKNQVPQAGSPADGPPASFMAYQNGQWTGPFTPDQMFSSGFLVPGNWVCPAGSQEVAQISQIPVLLSFLKAASGIPAAGTNLCPRCKVALAEVDYEGAGILKCPFCKGTLLKAGVLERLISRDARVFTADEIQKAQGWRNAQKGSIAERDHFPAISCPYCQNHMGKFVYSLLTQVIIDRCINEDCGAVWCDGGELEMIETLVEAARSAEA